MNDALVEPGVYLKKLPVKQARLNAALDLDGARRVMAEEAEERAPDS